LGRPDRILTTRRTYETEPAVRFFIRYGIGGAISLAFIYVYDLPYLFRFAGDPSKLLRWILVWWLVSLLGALIVGQLKVPK